jgi:hypothetical protein
MDKWLHHSSPSCSSRREKQAMSRGTDLCTFFRTILLGTLVALVNLAVWAWVVFVLLVSPFLLFNVTTLAMNVGIACGIIAAPVLLVLAVMAAPDAVGWVAQKTRQAVRDAPQRAPTFLQVFGRYLIGVKQRFCPTITIKDKHHD